MKHALVTGGTTGIGQAIALALLEAGYAVTVTGHSADSIVAMPKREHLNALELDVTKDSDCANSVVGLERLDVLVNCAGTILRQGKEFTVEGFQQVIDVNLTGTMRMCLAARDLLQASQGAIVNVASIWAMFGAPLNPAYTASKGGVVQLTKALAVAWAPDIRVNAVAPGWIETDMTAGISTELLAAVPARRAGRPEEVAACVRFLASEEAAYVTGAVLPVDGGLAA